MSDTNNLKDEQSLSRNIGEHAVKSLVKALKHTTLDLSNNKLGCDGLRYLTKVLSDNKIVELDLTNNNITDEDVKYLAESLKGTQISRLNLNNNSIGCSGLKYLSEALRDTQIFSLDLKNNNILDEGVEYLAQSLKGTQIAYLDLRENSIGCDAAQYLYHMLRNTNVWFDLNIYYSIGDVDKYDNISLRLCNNMWEITLHNNKIGRYCAERLNKMLKNTEIHQLRLNNSRLEADDAQYLNQAFKTTKIMNFQIPDAHLWQKNGIQYLVQAFKDTHFVNVDVSHRKYKKNCSRGALYLANFLKEVKVLSLNLDLHDIGDQGMQYLAPALKNSDIMDINLSRNDIGAEGARHLAGILQHSKIIRINLCNNHIGADGARHLADGLRRSQVTYINLHGNDIQYEGYQYLINVIDDTNLSGVNLYGNNIEAGKNDVLLDRITRDTTPLGIKISNAFKKLVSLNPMTSEFEFTVPLKKDIDPDCHPDQYAFLIRNLIDNPNSKVHIFDVMCMKPGRRYDFKMMDMINEFIAIMPNKFNIFINSKLPELVELFDSYDYVKLVEQFEDMKQYNIVQNLLLHRVLYYVDENRTILHPYIYKMLNKYSMPLYNEHLEPNKKEELISYYQNHQEIDGAQEIIDLLGSDSFK